MLRADDVDGSSRRGQRRPGWPLPSVKCELWPAPHGAHGRSRAQPDQAVNATGSELAAEPRQAGVRMELAHISGRGRPRPGKPVGLALLALGAASLELLLFSHHLGHGGLYTDDWPIAQIAHRKGILGLFGELVGADHGRPIGALYLAVSGGVSGTSGWWHALWGQLTLLFEIVSIVWLLWELGLAVRDSLAIGLLLLLFPFADSTWLWYVESVAGLSIGLAALGGVAACAGMRRLGKRSLLFHASAMGLFAASLLTYQVAAGLICCSLLIYLPRLPRRRAVALWLADVVTVGVVLAVPRFLGGPGGTAVPIVSLQAQVHHGKVIADQALTLATGVLVPFGAPHRNVVLPLAAGVLIIGAVGAWRLLSRRDPAQAELQRWLRWALAGCLVVAAAYAVYVPAPEALYLPLGAGANNRTNALAAVGFAILAYSLVLIVSIGILALARRPVRWAWAPALIGLTLLAIGYGRRTEADLTLWDNAAASQRQQLEILGRMPTPRRGETLFVFGGRGLVAPGVFAFRVTWDLNEAAKLMWNDASVRAFPIFAGTQMRCGTHRVIPLGSSNGDGAAQAAAFGRAEFVDLRTGRVSSFSDQQACQRAADQFIAGPVS